MEKTHAKLIKQQYSSLISIQNCMVGSSEAFYDYDYFKQNKIKKDSNSYTQNIKFLEKKDGFNVKENENYKEQNASRMHVEMQNLGLVLIIQTKNAKALEIILK
jgi:hypothetical protein